MDTDIPQADYDEILALIGDDTSPVGIDAKKTHIIIIHKLMDLQRRLDRLERLHGTGLG